MKESKDEDEKKVTNKSLSIAFSFPPHLVEIREQSKGPGGAPLKKGRGTRTSTVVPEPSSPPV